jgi:hypothetical protein
MDIIQDPRQKIAIFGKSAHFSLLQEHSRLLSNRMRE